MDDLFVIECVHDGMEVVEITMDIHIICEELGQNLFFMLVTVRGKRAFYIFTIGSI